MDVDDVQPEPAEELGDRNLGNGREGRARTMNRLLIPGSLMGLPRLMMPIPGLADGLWLAERWSVEAEATVAGVEPCRPEVRGDGGGISCTGPPTCASASTRRSSSSGGTTV